mmetsp:Transcript_5175/g.17038  ORF Transcript_5175/g.17038 Transcript_5175/m.17038 type:complete len:333 (-) Transcript_5175:118-1116(-)
MMNAFTIEFPSACIKAILEGYPLCGIQLIEAQHIHGGAHYSGTYFWADCDHVARLPPLDDPYDYWAVEFAMFNVSNHRARRWEWANKCAYNAYSCMKVNLAHGSCPRQNYLSRLFELLSSPRAAAPDRNVSVNMYMDMVMAKQIRHGHGNGQSHTTGHATGHTAGQILQSRQRQSRRRDFLSGMRPYQRSGRRLAATALERGWPGARNSRLEFARRIPRDRLLANVDYPRARRVDHRRERSTARRSNIWPPRKQEEIAREGASAAAPRQARHEEGLAEWCRKNAVRPPWGEDDADLRSNYGEPAKGIGWRVEENLQRGIWKLGRDIKEETDG